MGNLESITWPNKSNSYYKTRDNVLEIKSVKLGGNKTVTIRAAGTLPDDLSPDTVKKWFNTLGFNAQTCAQIYDKQLQQREGAAFRISFIENGRALLSMRNADASWRPVPLKYCDQVIQDQIAVIIKSRKDVLAEENSDRFAGYIEIENTPKKRKLESSENPALQTEIDSNALLQLFEDVCAERLDHPHMIDLGKETLKHVKIIRLEQDEHNPLNCRLITSQKWQIRATASLIHELLEEYNCSGIFGTIAGFASNIGSWLGTTHAVAEIPEETTYCFHPNRNRIDLTPHFWVIGGLFMIAESNEKGEIRLSGELLNESRHTRWFSRLYNPTKRFIRAHTENKLFITPA